MGGIVKGMGFFEVDIYVSQRVPYCRVLFELVNSHDAIVAFSIASIGKAIERPGAVVMYSQVTVKVATADEAWITTFMATSKGLRNWWWDGRRIVVVGHSIPLSNGQSQGIIGIVDVDGRHRSRCWSRGAASSSAKRVSTLHVLVFDAGRKAHDLAN